MPWLLRVCVVVSVLLGVFTGLASLAFLMVATVGAGPYIVQGATVSRAEFMAFAVPVLLGETVLSIMSIAVAWGLFRRRYWARPLMVGLGAAAMLFSLLAGTLVGLPMKQVLFGTVSGAVGVLILWWTLYRRDDMVDWFEALREAE